MSYDFSTRINGIPCICRVLDYIPAQHVPLGAGDSYVIPASMLFEILDRKGYKAAWLLRYVDHAVIARLTEEYEFEVMAEQAGIADTISGGSEWDAKGTKKTSPYPLDGDSPETPSTTKCQWVKRIFGKVNKLTSWGTHSQKHSQNG